jgi:rhodanese-related sulfurtransferase
MVKPLDVRELRDRLKAKGDKPVILDVREDWEWRTCHLPDSVHIPMRQIPMRAAELPRDTEIVVMCHHGIRSQQVANFLAQHGFKNLYNLTGGIDAWAKDVDPTTPIY